MTTIHFVYAGDPNGGAISSPYCITQNVYHFFAQKCREIPGLELAYYNWTDQRVVQSKPDDIIIGHPNYDPNTIIQRSFRESPCKAKFTIHPIHTRMVEDNMPFDHLTRAADRFFGICGPYWYDTMQNTPFAHWKEKMTRLDMAVNTHHFPFLKTQINPVPERRFLYIGSDTKHKNLGYLREIMQRLPGCQLYWFGGHSGHPLAQLPNVRVTGNVVLNSEMGKHICNATDMMINVSSSDANPTTLLETAAWGLPVACTPGSGYYGGSPFFEIPEGNADAAANILKHLINTPSEQLDIQRMANLEKIKTHYTWDNFCNSIWSVLEKYL